MPDFIDNFLNKITMYRLVMYFLLLLLVQAMVLSLFGLLPYSVLNIFLSALFLTVVCLLVNKVFAWGFASHANSESFYITAFILALIIAPQHTLSGYWFLFWAAALAMASKYILAVYKKHIFNPAALAVVITGLVLNQYAVWWVGTAVMLPLVFIGGVLVVRKIQRFDLVFSFLFTALLTCFTLGFFSHISVLLIAKQILLDSCLFFFGFIMLTEPMTTPPTENLQVVYGALVGFLFSPQVHFGGFYLTPEMALLIGNVFAYVVSPKQKLLLTLKEKVMLSPFIYNFVFSAEKPFNFRPGQYLEWTLGHKKSDLRGNRRYFTVASSPTEREIIIGVKYAIPSSTFKQALLALQPGDKILAGQLAGDFTLPKDPKQKLVFIAGGIGITPFRSMVKYLLDKNERRDIVMVYVNKNPQDVVYLDILEQAKKSLGLRALYTVSENPSGSGWTGPVGRVGTKTLEKFVPDYSERLFYISGSKIMVDSFKNTLDNLGIPERQIKTDFFPGFA